MKTKEVFTLAIYRDMDNERDYFPLIQSNGPISADVFLCASEAAIVAMRTMVDENAKTLPNDLAKLMVHEFVKSSMMAIIGQSSFTTKDAKIVIDEHRGDAP